MSLTCMARTCRFFDSNWPRNHKYSLTAESQCLRVMRKRRHKQSTKRGRTVSVIAWEGFGWGIDIDHGNGRHKAYPVGTREAAETEAERVRSGGRPWTREQVRRIHSQNRRS